MQITRRYFKYIASAILLIPITILIVFTIGEMIGGDISGAGHLLQLAPIAILLALAWKFPRIIGAILVLAGITLGILYAAMAHFPISAIIFTELLLFTPPIIAGVLFFFANQPKN